MRVICSVDGVERGIDICEGLEKTLGGVGKRESLNDTLRRVRDVGEYGGWCLRHLVRNMADCTPSMLKNDYSSSQVKILYHVVRIPGFGVSIAHRR